MAVVEASPCPECGARSNTVDGRAFKCEDCALLDRLTHAIRKVSNRLNLLADRDLYDNGVIATLVVAASEQCRRLESERRARKRSNTNRPTKADP